MAANRQNITCIIVDDNPIARESLLILAHQIEDLKIVHTCENAILAYNYLQSNEVDLILLDIEMPQMTGLELTRNLGKKDFLIIFTTSNKDYAIEAFDLNVVDYLVKPFSSERFFKAIDKVREIQVSKNDQTDPSNEEFIFVRDTNIIRRLRIDEILYAEAMGDYVKFYTQEKLFAIHTTLKAVEERLPKTKFIRIHRSYIISLQHIDTLQEGGMVVRGQFLPIADRYRKSLHQMMNII